MINYPNININGKTKKMHIYIWEQYYGPVPKGYTIHHKDRNPANYNIENLELKSYKEHNAIHKPEVSPLIGINLEEYHKENISKGLKNYYNENEVWNKGIPLTGEWKERSRLGHIGLKLKEETKIKIGEANKGRKNTEEQRERIRLKTIEAMNRPEIRKKYLESINKL